MNNNIIKGVSIVLLLGIVLFSVQGVDAGIGIKWTKESLMLNEGETACIKDYSVYNPWGADSGVIVSLGGDLRQVLVMQDTDTTLVPAFTSSENAIPVEFCFKVPRVYERDCSIGDTFICELTCEEEQKMYEGEVILKGAPTPTTITGTGGSATIMSVSAPLRIRVRCNPHPRDYTLIYVLVAIICALIIFIVLFRRYRKPKVQRDKERLAKLKAEIARESGKGKKKKAAKKKPKRKKK